MEEFTSKWRNLIAGILAVLVLCYGTYNYIYKPKLKEIEKLKSSLKLIESEISAIQGGAQLLKDPAGAKVLLNKELEEISKKIPSESETPYLINNFISVVGKGLNIDYNLIQPSNLEQEQKYKRLPLKVEFVGNYADLNSYLVQLKQLPVTIRVDSMELVKMSGTNDLAVRMALSAFVMPGWTEKPPGGIKGASFVSDPFYSETKKPEKGEPEKPQLEKETGLRYSGYFKGREIKAVINDDVLGMGQSIQGFKLLKIFRDKVVLLKNKKVIELFLRENK